MPYAIISDSLVVNIATADADFAQSQGWVECSDSVSIGWEYNDGVFSPPTPNPDYLKAANKAKAETLLADTDWTTLPDVSDPSNNPYLTNVNEFYNYRNAIRAIAVNPPEVVDTWPTQPENVWSS